MNAKLIIFAFLLLASLGIQAGVMKNTSFMVNERGINIHEVSTLKIATRRPGTYEIDIPGVYGGQFRKLEGQFNTNGQSVIRLSTRWAGQSVFRNWVNSREKKTISITLLNETGRQIRVTLFNVTPTKVSHPDFNGGPNETATETVEIVSENVEIDPED